MTELSVLFVCLLYALVPAAIVLFLSTAENALRILFAGASLFCALTGLYLLNGPTFTPEGLAVFTAPFQPLLQPSLTAKILTENWLGLVLAIVAGGFAFGAPLRRILTNAVISDAKSLARAELDQERRRQQDKHETALRRLHEATADAEKRSRAAQAKAEELTEREKDVEQQESVAAKIRKDLIADIDRHNAAVEEFNAATREERRQIKTLSQANERFKAMLAKYIPYKAAWRKVFTAAPKEGQDYLRDALKQAKEEHKAQRVPSPHAARAPIPTLPSEAHS